MWIEVHNKMFLVGAVEVAVPYCNDGYCIVYQTATHGGIEGPKQTYEEAQAAYNRIRELLKPVVTK